MPASDPRVEVVLPFGLPDGRGRRARGAVLTPLNGHGEVLGAEDANPFRAVLSLLAASVARIGPFHRDEMDLALLGALLPLDCDFLLVQLDRITFGDVRFQTVICPAEGCGKRVDVKLDLSTVTPPAVPGEAGGRLSLPDGRAVRYRLLTAGDQAALHDVPEGELTPAFLDRCLLPEVAGGPPAPSPGEVLSLPDALRAAIVREVIAASPALDLTLELPCAECGQPFRFVHEPVHALLRELTASRPATLREVHWLAYHYHWSQAEILGLPRGLRREYLALLDQELTRQAGAFA